MRPTPENIEECLDELGESIALDYEQSCDDEGKVGHIVWRADVVGFTLQYVRRLRAEVERLRGALAKIRDFPTTDDLIDYGRATARKALAGEETDE